MEATLRPANTLASSTSAPTGSTGAQSTAATGRATAVRPLDADSRLVTRTPPSAAPLKRGIDWNQNLQSEVSRAQQALDYLERVASQLEALKAELSSKLSGRSNPARQIEARARQLDSSLNARRKQGGDGIDAQLDFNGGQPAQQRFRIQGLDIASLQASAPQTLGFSVGSAGGPQLAATIEPGMTPEEIAQRLDRALAPVKVRVGLDDKHQLVFSTAEADWVGVKDAIAVTGRGRVETVEEAPSLAPQNWELGNPDALRQSLREVVQALARVRRSQDAAAAALSAAMTRTAQPEIPEAELAMVSSDFAASAAGHDYASLLAITSALVGVNRDRVQALLGLR
ncbi:hypothetical protein [Massilia sp. DD77]|uniref:hypothetical protein n=1 Tax=Massilia sp. DD77 TaxID=3109349 RepID=UPI002FFF8F70